MERIVSWHAPVQPIDPSILDPCQNLGVSLHSRSTYTTTLSRDGDLRLEMPSQAIRYMSRAPIEGTCRQIIEGVSEEIVAVVDAHHRETRQLQNDETVEHRVRVLSGLSRNAAGYISAGTGFMTKFFMDIPRLQAGPLHIDGLAPNPEPDPNKAKYGVSHGGVGPLFMDGFYSVPSWMTDQNIAGTGTHHAVRSFARLGKLLPDIAVQDMLYEFDGNTAHRQLAQPVDPNNPPIFIRDDVTVITET